jgi:hypothetical protein
LGFGGLLRSVAAALIHEPGGASEAGAFVGSGGEEGVAEVEEWIRQEAWARAVVHVEVRGEAIGGVEEGDGAGDEVLWEGHG